MLKIRLVKYIDASESIFHSGYVISVNGHSTMLEMHSTRSSLRYFFANKIDASYINPKKTSAIGKLLITMVMLGYEVEI